MSGDVEHLYATQSKANISRKAASVRSYVNAREGWRQEVRTVLLKQSDHALYCEVSST